MPDLSTRQFLYKLHSLHRHIPIYALVDFDPAGVIIMRTYKFGSPGLGHEQRATVPNLSWLGLKSSDILTCDRKGLEETSTLPRQLPERTQTSSRQSSTSGESDGPSEARCYSPLTNSDRQRAAKLIGNLLDGVGRGGNDTEIVHELQVMLLLNIKAEIQAVDDIGSMAGWLDERLLSNVGSQTGQQQCVLC